MKRPAIWILAVGLAMVLALRMTGLAGESPSPAPATAPAPAALEEAVRAEVQRQLPELVKKEVARQMEEMRRPEERAALQQAQELLARWNSAASCLQTLRSQIELYKLQHKDRCPTLEQMADWSVLVNATDADGRICPEGNGGFGPYLQRAPESPFTDKSLVVRDGTATAESGWTYDPQTGKLWVVVLEKDLPDRKDLSGWTTLTDDDIEVVRPQPKK